MYKLTARAAALLKPKSASVTKLTIPATVKANGKTWKVTAIKENAFKGLPKTAKVKK